VGSLDLEIVRSHNVELAQSLSVGLGLPETNSAILSWADADGNDLKSMTAAGLTASGRAGRARVAFHLWNTMDDVEAVLQAVRG
jgi:selenocysteine lyase/cysteine desulfurase